MRVPDVTISNLAAFLTGVLASFSVALVGAMPVGELILLAVNFWVLMALATTRRWPSALEDLPLAWIFLAGLSVAFCGYILADFYRESATRDIARGWAWRSVDIFWPIFIARAPRATSREGGRASFSRAWIFSPWPIFSENPCGMSFIAPWVVRWACS